MKKKDGLKEAREAKKARDEKRQIVSTLGGALERIDELEAYVEGIKALRNANSETSIVPREGTNTSEAVAFAVATDWHIGSVVRPETVSNLNQYDVSTAKKRIESFFEKTVRLIRKERQDVKISELVLFLGGDLIDGALHLDTIMSNEIAEPIKQAVVAQNLIESGINFLLNHGKLKKLTVVCCDGNHGRITHRMHYTSRQGNALEYFMYWNVAARFPHVNWVIADGLHVYLPVYNFNVRFHHGDSIYFGGINGPYTYLNRRIQEWDKAVRADYSVQGHY